jgi:hypothetical protein
VVKLDVTSEEDAKKAAETVKEKASKVTGAGKDEDVVARGELFDERKADTAVRASDCGCIRRRRMRRKPPRRSKKRRRKSTS